MLALDSINNLGEMVPNGYQGFTGHGHNCGADSSVCLAPVVDPSGTSPGDVQVDQLEERKNADGGGHLTCATGRETLRRSGGDVEVLRHEGPGEFVNPKWPHRDGLIWPHDGGVALGGLSSEHGE